MNNNIKIISAFLICIFLSTCKDYRTQKKEIKKYTSVQSELIDTLIYKSNSLVTGIKLNIKGNSKGVFSFSYSHKPYKNGNSIELENSFNETIKTDWYEPECVIKIIPSNGASIDSLSLSYEFY